MDPLDRLDKLELRADLLREIDRVREEGREKADRKELATMAVELSRMQLDQSERNRALRDGFNELERAVKAMAAMIPQDSPARRGFSLSNIDPKILLMAGIAGGAAAGKTLEIALGAM
jgi:hypothetical protein